MREIINHIIHSTVCFRSKGPLDLLSKVKIIFIIRIKFSIFCFNKWNASEKQFKINLFDFFEIFSNIFFWLYFISITGIDLPFKSSNLKLFPIFWTSHFQHFRMFRASHFQHFSIYGHHNSNICPNYIKSCLSKSNI